MKSLYAVIVSLLFLSATQKAEAIHKEAIATGALFAFLGITSLIANEITENHRKKELLIKKKKALEKKLRECPACQIAYDDIVQQIEWLDKNINDAPGCIILTSGFSVGLAFLLGTILASDLLHS